MKNIIKFLKKYSISITISLIVIACISIFGVSQIENVHKIKYYLPNLFFGATDINHLHKYFLITMIILLFILLNQIDKEYNKKIKQSENTQDFFKVAIINGLLYGLLTIVAALIGVYIGSIIYDIKFGYGFYINYFQFFIMIYALSYSFILFVSYITKSIKLSLLLYFCIFFIVPNIYIKLGYTTLSDFNDNNFLNLFFLDFNKIGYKILDFNINDQLLWIIIILFCSILPVISINKIKNINFKLHVNMICKMIIELLLLIFILKSNSPYYLMSIMYLALILFDLLAFNKFFKSNKIISIIYFILTFVVMFLIIVFNLNINKENNNNINSYINSIVEFTNISGVENKDYINVLKTELKKAKSAGYISHNESSYNIVVVILDENGYYDLNDFYIDMYSEFYNLYSKYMLEFMKDYIKSEDVYHEIKVFVNNQDEVKSEDKTCLILNKDFLLNLNENQINYSRSSQEVRIILLDNELTKTSNNEFIRPAINTLKFYFPIDVLDYQDYLCETND